VPLAARPDPPPLETDDVRLITVGAAGFAVAFVVLMTARIAGAGVHTWWIVMCAEGAVLGLMGILYCRRRRDALARPQG